MKNIYFYLPFAYLFKSRIYTFYKALSWFILYIIPTFLLWNSIYPKATLLQFFIAVLLIYNYYEIGYIQNDTETIKKESNPTLRLNKSGYDYYEKNKISIYVIRLILGIIILLYIYPKINIVFIVFLFLILLLYLIYNNIRNRWNLLVNFCLVSIRYIAPLLVGGATLDSSIILSAIFIYPLLNFLERASSERFHIIFFQKIISNKKKLTSLRVLYYLFFLIIYVIITFSCSNMYLNQCFLFALLFVFRFLVWLGDKLGLTPSKYLSA